jgi:hypothetical protein
VPHELHVPRELGPPQPWPYVLLEKRARHERHEREQVWPQLVLHQARHVPHGWHARREPVPQSPAALRYDAHQ